MTYFRIFTIIITVIFCGSAIAADLFTVDDIKVSSSGSSAKGAKDAAVLAGQREALANLLERIASNPSQNKLANIDAEKLAGLVRGIEINNEKITASYYSATLSISFNRSLVEQLLKDNNISFTSKKSLPIVVIPVLISRGKTMIFASDNQLKNSLVALAGTSHVLDIVVPQSGVDEDKITTNIETLDADTATSILQIGQSYNAEKVFLVVASANAGDMNKLNIRMKDIKDIDSQVREISLNKSNLQSGEDIYNCAARNLILFFESQWMKSKAEANAPGQKIIVSIPFASLEEWASTRRKLGNFPFIKDINLMVLNIQSAMVELSFADSLESFSSKLNEQGFVLEGSGDAMVLRNK